MVTPDINEARDSSGLPLWQKPWLTVPETMRLMRVGRATVAQMVKDGRWAAVTVGKRQRIATDSIRRDLDRQAEALKLIAAA